MGGAGDGIVSALVAQRTGIWSDRLVETEKYKELEKVRSELYMSITEQLPEEKKELTDRLDEEIGRLLAMSEEYFYLCGLKDGIQMRELFVKDNL